MQQNDAFNQIYFNSTVFNIPWVTTLGKSTPRKATMGQLTTVLLFIELFPKKYANMDQKVNQRQNTVGLEQQIYASPDNFTPTLLVMLETFRRSAKLRRI